jgi:hypothetical protein
VSSVISGDGDVVARSEGSSSIEFNGQGNMFRGTLFVGFLADGDISFNKSSGVVVNDALVIRGSTPIRVTPRTPVRSSRATSLSTPARIGSSLTAASAVLEWVLPDSSFPPSSARPRRRPTS